MPRNPVERNNVSWEDRHGTTASGNLPQYRDPAVSSGVQCLHDTITSTALSTIQSKFPWVTFRDFHYYHFKCPYSTEASIHLVRDIDRQSGTYWQMVSTTVTGSHTTTSGLMIRFSRGSKHGWLCVDPVCPYYNDPANGGLPYFYV